MYSRSLPCDQLLIFCWLFFPSRACLARCPRRFAGFGEPLLCCINALRLQQARLPSVVAIVHPLVGVA
jgi:hypothetical protein